MALGAVLTNLCKDLEFSILVAFEFLDHHDCDEGDTLQGTGRKRTLVVYRRDLRVGERNGQQKKLRQRR